MSQQQAIEDQLIEVAVAEVKERGAAGFTSFFAPADSTLSGALVGGTMALSSTAADKVTLYDQETGEPREGVLVNMLSKTLRKKRNGKPALGIAPPPGVTWQQGQVLCWFHPEHPNRAQYDQIGLRGRVCQSAHLASEYDARRHAENRHGQWAKMAREHEEKTRRETEADRQERMMAAMLKMAEGGSRKGPA